MKLDPPYACAWCSLERRSHGVQYVSDAVGWHVWQPPSEPLILARMLARRLARVTADRDRLRQTLLTIPHQQNRRAL